ncbi:hypothetical protein [Caldilinea sp.]|uniref:hypothetical protein n=1 Tax=Caldilinea sp. TaxID=2293560 RepID=UPI001B0D7BBE|nr:hypothetical protein [Caldilinea sp.]MBO9394213.1 hypothetical protein [Caldilinea sp.]
MSDGGIIQNFQERRQIEASIQALGDTTTEAELIAMAQDLVERFPPDGLAAAVLRHLGEANSQLRGGLGHLCALLPPEIIAPRLREIVSNRQKSPLERITAQLILERYLGETVSPALLSDLAGNNDIAMQSLQEALEEGRTNRHILLEYVTQMQEHGVDTALMVLDLLDRVPPSDRVELLRLIAQDQRGSVARAALERLSALATFDAAPQALRALHTLSFTLPPALAEQAQRALRKLQFTGKRYQPPSPEGWRALLSPSDANGHCVIWFVRNASTAERNDGVLIWVRLVLHLGVFGCSGAENLEETQLPPQRAIGELIPLEPSEETHGFLLEAPFDVGRWLLLQTLQRHWIQKDVDELPGEYRLYNDLLWQFAPPVLPEAYRSFFHEERTAISGQPDMEELELAATQLVEHPAMQVWTKWASNVWSMLPPLPISLLPEQARGVINHILHEIEALPQRQQFLEGMTAALKTQALWLAISGDHKAAEQATILSRWMQSLPAPQNPLLIQLLWTGLIQQEQRRST